METKLRLEFELKNAMKAGESIKRDTIRMALSAIKNMEIDKGHVLEESAIISIIQKEIKIRKETISDAKKADRKDIILTCQKEISELQLFLPDQLSETELSELIQETILETGAVSQKDMGKVMKVLLEKVSGRASSEVISQIVRKIITTS